MPIVYQLLKTLKLRFSEKIYLSILPYQIVQQRKYENEILRYNYSMK